MPKVQQTFVNRAKRPVFIYVEYEPELYKLQPGDRLTLIENVPEGKDMAEISFVSRDELSITPGGDPLEVEVLLNGKEGMSWCFKDLPKGDGDVLPNNISPITPAEAVTIPSHQRIGVAKRVSLLRRWTGFLSLRR